MKIRIVILLGMVLGTVSCGGGSSGGLAEGGIGGTGISKGSISAFGSIVVNGRHFDVDGAEITVNGEPAVQSDLDVGFVVRVDGDLQRGQADSVRFEADLIGEVDLNSIPAGQDIGMLTVLQQTVRVTATTVLDGVATPDLIGAGERVLVSGFRDSGDVLVATHLRVLSGTGTDQIVGSVTAVGANSFSIGTLDIVFVDPPDSGERVLVRGNYDPGSGRMPGANTVDQVEDLVIGGTEIELEGIVDTLTNNSDFKVNGIPVDASGAMIVDETGAPVVDPISQDAEVEIEGVFNMAGVLVAERVEVELEDNVRITARVVNTPVQGEPVQFFLAGSPLLSVGVNDKTQLRDKTDQPMQDFSVLDLVVDDWVELDGFENAAGEVVASGIERFDADLDEEASVEGVVDEVRVLENMIVILGIAFDVTMADFEDESDNPIVITDIAPGDLVEVTWTDDGTFSQPQPVEEVELEGDD